MSKDPSPHSSIKPIVLVGCGQVSRSRILPALKVLSREGLLTVGDIIDVMPPTEMQSVLRELAPLTPAYHQISSTPGELERLLTKENFRGRPVVVATPTTRHVEHVCAAAEAGCPVALEKPLAASVEGLDCISTCLGRSDSRLFFPLGYYLIEKALPLLALARGGKLTPVQRRCLDGPNVEGWKSLRDQLGRVVSITGVLREGIDDRSWVGDDAAGGHTLETFSHLIAVVLPWAKPLSIVRVQLGAPAESSGGRTENLIYAELAGPQSERIVLACQKATPREALQRWMRIDCENGHALMDFEKQRLTVQVATRVTEATTAAGMLKYEPQLRMFAEKMSDPNTPTEYEIAQTSVRVALDIRAAGLRQGLRELPSRWLDEQLRGTIHQKKPTVVVLGDPMIDRAWVVAQPAESSQSHGDVAPQKIVDPNLPNARPGGAALTCAWLAKRGFDVRLLVPVGLELSQLLTRAEVKIAAALLPDRQDTTKFRIYAHRGSNAPELRHRFDLDADPPPFEQTDDPVGADCIVVADFRKGAVTESRLKSLVKLYPQAHWYVDSKNPAIIKYDFWDELEHRPTLSVNREELALLAADMDNSRYWRPHIFSGRWSHIETLILDAASTFRQKFGHWDLVVKLDIDGAAAFWSKSDRWMLAYTAGVAIKQTAGIGAGDAFAAGWLAAMHDKEPNEGRLHGGVSQAMAWIECEQKATDPLIWPSQVPTPENSKDAAVNSRPPFKSIEPVEVGKRLDALKNANALEKLIESGQIRMADAHGHCGRFLTMDPEFGAAVRSFVLEIRGYFRSQDARRPLNCLVWAAPGSGKSFLVEEVAREVGAEHVEINVATMTGLTELKQRLESLRSVDKSKLLVMIDEFAAMSGGSHAFAALLNPLWSKIESKKVAFVLVDSKDAKNIEDFIKIISGKDKGLDLVSRLNGPKLSIPAPSRLDRAVLIASLIRRIHPKSGFAIEAGALEALVGGSGDTWTPRSMEYIVEALSPSGNAILYKDLQKISDLCLRLGIRLNVSSSNKRIALVD